MGKKGKKGRSGSGGGGGGGGGAAAASLGLDPSPDSISPLDRGLELDAMRKRSDQVADGYLAGLDPDRWLTQKPDWMSQGETYADFKCTIHDLAVVSMAAS